MGGHNKMNLVGQRFGRLVVTSEAGKDKHQCTLFKCVCACGTEKTIKGSGLRSGKSKSCGCLRVDASRIVGLKSRRHGHGTQTKTPTYRSWQHMIDRCCRESSDSYKWYGAKGVTVCDAWRIFDNFLSDMGERPSGMTLDRINPLGNYEPSNCRWADVVTQNRNTRRRYVECQQ